MKSPVIPILVGLLVILQISCLREKTVNSQAAHSPQNEHSEPTEVQTLPSIPGLNDLNGGFNPNLKDPNSPSKANPEPNASPDDGSQNG
jgi:hypothetical protein